MPGPAITEKNICMKFFLPGFGLWVILQAHIGCAPGIKVSTDYDRAADFSLYKTFTIADFGKNDEVSELNAVRITNAIRDNMQKKGFKETNTDADLLVNAVTMLKLKMTVTANSNFYGYGGVYRPYTYYGAGVGMANTTYTANEYTDGSLMIDIVNNKEKKLLWQGIGNAEIDKSSINNPERFINDAVTKIMAGFPPGGKKKR
jgi:hypothetical protein